MIKKDNAIRQNNLGKLLLWFWRHPNRLFALRITISMGILSIPFIVAGKPFYGVTLALGALAGALSETDDHPKGRLKALTITVLSFFVSSFFVGLLNNYPVLLGTGFVLSTILFILLGGIGERYRTITFGAILVGIYAMLGIEISPAWYWQAVLLPVGALVHGMMTLLLMYLNPWRLLEEQLAVGFLALSKYLDKKSGLFPSTREIQAEINKDLAILNINVVNSLEKIKEVLNNYGNEVSNPELLRPYLQRFMLLQSLHERAASSHERHDKLSSDAENLEIMEGFGEILRQLSFATRLLADSILTGSEYHHPPAIEWISKAIEDKLQQIDNNSAQPLILLHHNLYRSHLSLKNLDNVEEGTSIPRLQKDERSVFKRFKSQLSFKHPRVRYAMRLSLSFLIGFILAESLQLEKGAWVMLTSLFVSQITYSDTRRRLFQRLLGTVTGVLAGALLLQVFTTTSAQLLLMLGSAMAFFYWLRTNYSVAVIFITMFVISAYNLVAADAGFHIMIPRLINTLTGAFISFTVIRFLWPGWQYKRMPGIISKALKMNMAYLHAIAGEYRKTSTDDLAYRIARRDAHLADNDLALAWYSMRQEPKSKQILKQHAFALTYLNHALLSQISALGAHRENNLVNIENIEEVTSQTSLVLTGASEFLLENSQNNLSDLSSLLLNLKRQIEECNSGIKKQQFRLLYNIADSANKMINEIKEFT
jgi:uncharacterized membrane protein (TIGR01666 family)